MKLNTFTGILIIACLFAGNSGYALEFSDGGFEKASKNGTPAAWGQKIDSGKDHGDSAKITLDTKTVKEGKYACRIDRQDSKNIVLLENQIPAVNAGTVLEISFWCKIAGDGQLFVRENHVGQNGRWRAELFRNFISDSGPHDWKKLTGTVKTAAGDKALGITLFIQGQPGTVWLDAFECREVKTGNGDGIVFRMTPNFYTDDNLFYLPQQTPMVVYLTCANRAQYESKNPRTIIEIPEEISLLSCGYDAVLFAPAEKILRNGRKYIRYDYAMSVPGSIMRNMDFSSTGFSSVELMIVADNTVPPDEIFNCYIGFKDEQTQSGLTEFKLKIMPRLPEVIAPEHFFVGFHPGTSLDFYGAALNRWMQSYKACGFGSIFLNDILRAGSIRANGSGRDAAPVFEAASANGISTFMSSNCLVNGYTLRYVSNSEKAPDSVKLKRADGVIVSTAFDPAYIARKGEWYIKALNQVVDDAVRKKCKGIWINWEPYMFIGEKGSFTELSLKDFAAFSGVPEPEVLNTTPVALVEKYRDKFYSFQSAQYAAAMQVMAEQVRRRSKELNHPLELVLCTGSIFFNDLTDKEFVKENLLRYRKTFMTEEWLKYFNIVSSWYYLYFKADDYKDKYLKELIELGYRIPETQTLKPASHAGTLEEVEKTVDFIREQCRRDGRAPVPYYHLTQNLQCNNWVVKPSEIAIQILAAFLGGASGVDLYFFPMGYDGRYWESATQANAQISMFEDYVMSGKKVSGCSVVALTELFQSNEADYSKRIALRVFEKNGCYLAAVANFDFLDAAPLKLVLNLPDGKYTISAPYNKQSFQHHGDLSFEAAELKQIPAIIPPLSVVFFELKPPLRQVSNMTVVSLENIETEINRLIPELNNKFRQRLEKADRITKTLEQGEQESLPHGDKFKPLSQNGFSTKAFLKEGKCYFSVTGASGSILIAPGKGAAVVSWINSGFESVFQDAKEGRICYDRFYLPSGYESGMDSSFYQFVEQKITGDGLELVFEKKLEKESFAGLTIIKTFVFKSGQARFELKYRIANKGSVPVCVGFWVWNCFAQGLQKFKPELRFGQRTLNSEMLKVTTFYWMRDVRELDKLLSGQKKDKIDFAEAVLQNADSAVMVTAEQDKLAGILTWYIMEQKVNTFETMFIPQLIQPGEQITYNLGYSYLKQAK